MVDAELSGTERSTTTTEAVNRFTLRPIAHPPP